MEFIHYLPRREDTSRKMFQEELRAWEDHAHWVIDNRDLFSPAMVRYQEEQLDLLSEMQHGRHFRLKSRT